MTYGALTLMVLARPYRGPHSYVRGENLFAKAPGLLGLFYEYYSDYVATPGKFWVAPNAIIAAGKMRRTDPEREMLSLPPNVKVAQVWCW